MKIVHSLKYWLLITGFIFISCEAPRYNPLDPNNPDNNLAKISGSVQTFSLPYTGIEDVSVYWNIDNKLVETNENGVFSIENVTQKNGILIFSKEGFLSDTVNVIWGNGSLFTTQVNLNKLPNADTISIYTVVINQFIDQTYELVISCKISDKDNDIDSVYVENNNLNLREPLAFNVTEKVYQKRLTMMELNISDIEETIGLDFDILVKDIFNREFLAGTDNVSRVIKNQVNILSPLNDSTVSSMPMLEWQRFRPGYSFSYMIEVYTNDFANSQLVFRQEGVSSEETTFQIPDPLPVGEYYWVVWVVDQFQNRSRSKPATFTVE